MLDNKLLKSKQSKVYMMALTLLIDSIPSFKYLISLKACL